MDTRTKILSEAYALELAQDLRARGVSLKAVTGYFDVLLAPHIRALRQIADGNSKLIALIRNPPDPLLPQAARAELVAALAAVDYVVAIPGDAAELLRKLQPAEIIRFEQDDARRTRNLIEHVQKRGKV